VVDIRVVKRGGHQNGQAWWTPEWSSAVVIGVVKRGGHQRGQAWWSSAWSNDAVLASKMTAMNVI